MSVGGHPGETLKLKCTEKLDGAVVLAGEGLALELTGRQDVLDYFHEGTDYVVSFTVAAGPSPDDGAGEASPG